MPISSEWLEYLETIADEKLCLSCWLEQLEEFLEPLPGIGSLWTSGVVQPMRNHEKPIEIFCIRTITCMIMIS